ncbi:alpha/beta hydrolase [Rhodococcus opacus]|uniref:Acetylxylan esterase n=1 Tax=Rhodococcus opacus TaxID=37919 RepID=A0A2S8IL86_RHOOP|nr:alpha/beta hydrolase [Rhodococcus opacus]PQP15152.1 acetylxylan esterase [Rhodococcus opacus]
MDRRDIEFSAEGVTIRGWFYPGQGKGPVRPTVILSHGFSAVKEQYLDRYAEVFAEAGVNALVYDNRNFGDSDGQPRQEVNPWQQVRDYRDAITFATTLPEVDADRIGVWGSSFSGGHVLVVAALDRRVKAVVSQGPMVDGYQNLQRMVRPDFVESLREGFDADRLARFNGADPATLPVVDIDPLAPSAMPSPDSYAWFTESGRTIAPNWRNEVTLRSVEMLSEYVPAHFIEYISPTPLLLLPAVDDKVTPTDLALAAYARAREPKRLEILPGGHFDIYTKGFEQSSSLALNWFLEHLTN